MVAPGVPATTRNPLVIRVSCWTLSEGQPVVRWWSFGPRGLHHLDGLPEARWYRADSSRHHSMMPPPTIRIAHKTVCSVWRYPDVNRMRFGGTQRSHDRITTEQVGLYYLEGRHVGHAYTVIRYSRVFAARSPILHEPAMSAQKCAYVGVYVSHGTSGHVRRGSQIQCIAGPRASAYNMPVSRFTHTEISYQSGHACSQKYLTLDIRTPNESGFMPPPAS